MRRTISALDKAFFMKVRPNVRQSGCSRNTRLAAGDGSPIRFGRRLAIAVRAGAEMGGSETDQIAQNARILVFQCEKFFAGQKATLLFHGNKVRQGI